MLPLEQPDRIHVAFDDHRLVANAGLLLPVTLARHLGLGELVDRHIDLGGALGRANAGEQGADPSGVGTGRWRLHRRRRRAARWGNRSGAGVYREAPIHRRDECRGGLKG